jgi:hypothetical protein
MKKLKNKKKLIIIIVSIVIVLCLIIGGIGIYFNYFAKDNRDIVATPIQEDIEVTRDYKTNANIPSNTFLQISHIDMYKYLQEIGFKEVKEVDLRYKGGKVKAWEASNMPYTNLPSLDKVSVLVINNQVETLGISLVYIEREANLDKMYEDMSGLNRMFNGFTIDKIKLKEVLDKTTKQFKKEDSVTNTISYKIDNIPFTINVTIDPAIGDDPVIYTVTFVQNG